jgi:hypothetical protein
VHLAAHFLAGAPRVFSFPFPSHSILLTKVTRKGHPAAPAVLSAAVREPTADVTIADTSVLVLLDVATRRDKESQFLQQPPGEMFFKNRAGCMSSEHFGQLAWQFKRMSGSSGLKVQAAIAC